MFGKPKFAQGGDQRTVSRVAEQYFGGYPQMFQYHNWSWPRQGAMSEAAKLIKEIYGSIQEFENLYRLETAHDVLDAYKGAWMKGFWGWSPETWGCIGYSRKGRVKTFLDNDLKTRLMFIYVTKSSKREGNDHLINRIVGFYEVTDVIGHRNYFMTKEQQKLCPEQWRYSIKARRAFMIRNDPLPFTFDIIPSFKNKGMGTKYGMNSAALSDEAYGLLKGMVYEEVPVFNVENRSLDGLSFPAKNTKKKISSATSRGWVGGGAHNPFGYNVKPELDSAKELYVLELIGNTSSFLGQQCEDSQIFKVGLSFCPNSRRDFFNRVLPTENYHWETVRSTRLDKHDLYPNFRTAERGEMAMKRYLAEHARHLGGEFYLANKKNIDEAWKIGRSAALNALNKA
jgi:hypothetical protein